MISLIQIGFQIFQVTENGRILKHVREDGELFFIRIQIDYPRFELYWASDESVKPDKKIVLYGAHTKYDDALAQVIVDFVRDFNPPEYTINRLYPNAD